ncbi:hypothetical protein DTL70_30495 [Streptomyces diacarni]|uniref:Uncharacterized protein n=1 Tax=Streptomyces diacarni TaxID=2800381 RepID=A0A367EC94_9ACTN|nr:DUF6000 family protein [Streptomyces diacarni]RCG15674.1 hypothetical protein DTL70_30495 [Streptomyces diacarni]
MRRADEDPELLRLVRRYVTPGQRYLKLGGSVLGMTGRRRTRFARKLGQAAGRITLRELSVLLEGGWRERQTAAWFIAITRKTEFRGRLGELLLDSEVCFAGQAYCVALAAFSTPADADLLTAYLDRYLRCPELDYDQGAALGALLLLDVRLGCDQATRFLAPGGLWQQWLDGPPSKSRDAPDSYRETIGELCVFAAACAGHGSGPER